METLLLEIKQRVDNARILTPQESTTFKDLYGELLDAGEKENYRQNPLVLFLYQRTAIYSYPVPHIKMYTK